MTKKKISKKNIELSDEYLYKAYESQNDKETEEYISKSLELNPNNINSLLFLIEPIDDPYEKLKYIETIIEKASEQLKNEEFFTKEYVGAFWGVYETRPYMKSRQMKILSLIDVGYFHQAIKECEELLVLSENDNLGIRYILMGLYAYVKDSKLSQKLYKKFDEDLFMFLFPYGISLYNSDLFDNAKEVFQLIDIKYPFFNRIFLKNLKPTKTEIESMKIGVPAGQPGEVYITLADTDYLITKEFKQWYSAIHNN